MNINPTPYTTELLITEIDYYGYDKNRRELIIYMMTKTGITPQLYEKINNGKYVYLKKYINKYKIIEYQPLDEEIIYDDDFDDESSIESVDELEKAIQDGLKI